MSQDRIDNLIKALIEIRDVAEVSEGSGWYLMIARTALDQDKKLKEKK